MQLLRLQPSTIENTMNKQQFNKLKKNDTVALLKDHDLCTQVTYGDGTKRDGKLVVGNRGTVVYKDSELAIAEFRDGLRVKFSTNSKLWGVLPINAIA